MARSTLSASSVYDQQNREAAQIIVRNGVTGGLRIWAEAVLARLSKSHGEAEAQRPTQRTGGGRATDRPQQGSLFDGGAA